MKKKTNNLLAVTLLISILLASCDKSSLNDHELFNRLQSKGGKWKVVQYEKWDNTELNPTRDITYPNDYFYHFYFKSIDLLAGAGIFAYGDFYVDGVLNFSNSVEAETERVSFPVGLGDGEVWTVETNQLKKQVWTKMEGNEATRITLERCDCALPDAPGETGG